MSAESKTRETTRATQANEQPKRTDYTLCPSEIENGDRRPVEVYEFAEALRMWREQSANSNLVLK